MQHVRFALRSLSRTPLFALVAITTLAVGIGAVTTIFSLLQAQLLAPLPYPGSERLVSLHMTLREPGEPLREFGWSYPKYQQFVKTARSYQALAAFSGFEANLQNGTSAERISMEIATSSYLPVLGVTPAVGRDFLAAEDVKDGGRVVLISWGLWKRAFGAASDAVGKTIQINKKPLTIVGVLPSGFRGLGGEADAWVPFGLAGDFVYPGVETEGGNHWHAAVGRLAPNTTVAQANAEASAIAPAVAAMHEQQNAKALWGAAIEPLEAFRVDPTTRRATILLFGAVLLVLAIACANVAALQLARGASRGRELSIRAALGAGRARLVRQMLAESVLLSLAGGLAGTLIALWSTSFLSRLTPESSYTPGGFEYLFRFTSVQMDGRVLLFALAVSIATGLAFGVLPALHASRVDPAQGLKEGAPGSGQPAGSLARRLLVPAQVALATVLLVGAGLLTTSLLRLQGLPTGFDPKNVLTFRFEAPENAAGRRDPAVVQRLIERVGSLPGARGASAGFCAPGAGRCMVNVVRDVDSASLEKREPRIEIGALPVTPNYFENLAIPIRRGRAFTERDHAEGAPRVVLINETAAKMLWPGADPVGHRIGVTNYYFADGQTAEVIGVVADVRNGRPGEAPMPDVYVPLYSYILPMTTVFVRTEASPETMVPAIRRAVAEIDPNLAVFRVQTLEQRLADVVSRQRLAARLLSLLAVVAAFLAAVGLYGLMAESVARRTREIGVRMALGARPAEVRLGVLGRGLAHFAAGLIAGLVAAALLSRLLTALLFETRPLDPGPYALVALVLLAVSTAASWIPARRATRIDPMAALRSE